MDCEGKPRGAGSQFVAILISASSAINLVHGFCAHKRFTAANAPSKKSLDADAATDTDGGNPSGDDDDDGTLKRLDVGRQLDGAHRRHPSHRRLPRPPDPAATGGLTYLFPGLSPKSGDVILQPVLQWGNGAAGGGKYGAGASWDRCPANKRPPRNR